MDVSGGWGRGVFRLFWFFVAIITPKLRRQVNLLLARCKYSFWVSWRQVGPMLLLVTLLFCTMFYLADERQYCNADVCQEVKAGGEVVGWRKDQDVGGCSAEVWVIGSDQDGGWRSYRMAERSGRRRRREKLSDGGRIRT